MIYNYCGYLVNDDGVFISPHGNILTWKDDKYIKIELDGVVRRRNGLNLLYEIYNGVSVRRTHLVCYKNPESKSKSKENLILIPKGLSQIQSHRLTKWEIYRIREEYAISIDERKKIRNSNDHPSISMRALAQKYNVSLHTIQRVLDCSDPSNYYKSDNSFRSVE